MPTEEGRCEGPSASAQSHSKADSYARTTIEAQAEFGRVRTTLSKPLADDVRNQCSDWLAINEQIESLSARWAAIEALLGTQSQSPNLTAANGNALSGAHELSNIRAGIDELRDRRRQLWSLLPTFQATSLGSLAAKLAVIAVAIHPDDDEEANLLIVSALHDLWDLKCPNCGTSLFA